MADIKQDPPSKEKWRLAEVKGGEKPLETKTEKPPEKIVIRISDTIPKPPQDPKVRTLDTAIKATTGQAVKTGNSNKVVQEAARELWRRGVDPNRLDSAVRRSSATLNERDKNDLLNIVGELKKLYKAYPDTSKKFGERLIEKKQIEIKDFLSEKSKASDNSVILEKSDIGLFTQNEDDEYFSPEYVNESQGYVDNLTGYADNVSERPDVIDYEEPEMSPPSVRMQQSQPPEPSGKGINEVLNRGRSAVTDSGKKIINNAVNTAKSAGQKAIKQGLSKLAGSAAPVLGQAGLYIGAAVGIITALIAWLAMAIITVLMWMVGFTVFVALILIIINSGAYMVPPGENLTTSGPAVGPTPYQGELPEECPSGWPLSSGYLTQGAYAPECSHYRLEATDYGVAFADVFATHAGVVTFADWDNCCGNMVRLSSICNGQEFYSVYCHFESLSVSAGDAVAKGTVLGVSGGTGSCTYPPGALHLHYGFHYPGGGATGASDDSYVNFPPYMNPPYLPAEIPRGCCQSIICGVSF